MKSFYSLIAVPTLALLLAGTASANPLAPGNARGFTMHFEFEQNFKVEIEGVTQGAFVRGIVLGVDEFVQEQALFRHASGGMLPTGETAQF